MIPDEDEMKSYPVTYGKIIDPDGYTVEVIEGISSDPICKIILGVTDLNDSIEYYVEKMKMNLLRKRANIFSTPKSASLVAYVVIHPPTDTYVTLHILILLHIGV